MKISEVVQYMKDNKLNPLKADMLDIHIKEKIFKAICKKYKKDGAEFLVEEGIGIIEILGYESDGLKRKPVAVRLSLLVNFN